MTQKVTQFLFSRRGAASLVAALAVLFAGELIGLWQPDPCPARASLAPAEFPPQSPLAGMGNAQALPIFARQFNLTCTTCHIAFPQLNAFGRKFKELGYRMPDAPDPEAQHQHKVSENLTFLDNFPIAGHVQSVFFEKETGNAATFAPLTEITLHVAGAVFEKGSAFLELGGDLGSGFAVSGTGRIGYHISPYLNITAGQGDVFMVDPYNTLNSHILQTEDPGGVDHRVVNVYGRWEKLYYSAGFSAGPTGQISTEYLGTLRLAYDISDDLSVGAFGILGSQLLPETDDNSGIKGDRLRAGVDVNYLLGTKLSLQALGALEKTTIAGQAQTRYDGWFQAYYTFIYEDRPIFVPLVRAELTQTPDTGDNVVRLLGNVSTYVAANARVGLEYAQEVVSPTGRDAISRFRAFGVILF